jgi:hypothetical protein
LYEQGIKNSEDFRKRHKDRVEKSAFLLLRNLENALQYINLCIEFYLRVVNLTFNITVYDNFSRI